MDDIAVDNLRRRPTRRLKVDLVELAAAFDNGNWEMSYFLDLETGRVILITADTRRQHDQLVEAIGDVDQTEWTTTFEPALKDWEMPAWQRQSVRAADQAEPGMGERLSR